MPVTSPARTLLDRAGGQTAAQIEREYDELRIARLVQPHDVIDAIDRAPHRRCGGLLRELVELEVDPVDLREEGERRLRELPLAGGVKAPRHNGTILGHSFDAVWFDEMFIVEFDGYGVHTRRRKFERDRDKTNYLQHRGWLGGPHHLDRAHEVPGARFRADRCRSGHTGGSRWRGRHAPAGTAFATV